MPRFRSPAIRSSFTIRPAPDAPAVLRTNSDLPAAIRYTTRSGARSVDLAFTISRRASPSEARLELFDPAGRLVTCLWRGRLPAGRHQRNWNGRSDAGRPMSAGVYFARLTTADGVQSRKLIPLGH